MVLGQRCFLGEMHLLIISHNGTELQLNDLVPLGFVWETKRLKKGNFSV